jgi:hypothetical protein
MKQNRKPLVAHLIIKVALVDLLVCGCATSSIDMFVLRGLFETVKARTCMWWGNIIWVLSRKME